MRYDDMVNTENQFIQALSQRNAEQRTRQMMFEDAQRKADMDLQGQIALANAKAKVEAQYNPESQFYNAILGGGGATTTEPTTSGVVPVTTNNGIGVNRDQLIKGFLEKKFGISPLRDKKTELEIQGLEQKNVATAQSSENETDLIRSTAQSNLDTIKAIKDRAKYFGPYANLPTLATSAGGLIDYKNRKIWENNLNKLLSQKVVDLITTMKSASKTGATGFGQLSEKEGQLLREASTALSKDLDSETAIGYLNDMEKIYKKILSKSNTSTQTNTATPTITREQAIAELKRRGKI